MDADDAVSEHLLPRLPRGGAGAGTCPDDNVLAATAEGRLPREQAALVDAHLARCARCREEVVTLAGLGPDAGAVPAVRGRLLRFPLALGFAVAATLLLALGALLWTRGKGAEPAGAEDLEGRLVAEAARFPGFRPILRAERLATKSSVERGALLLGTPAGVVFDVRPNFEWQPVPGATAYDVSLVGEDGAILWTRRTASTVLPFPEGEKDLPGGFRGVWQVAADGPLGRVEGRRSFRMLPFTFADVQAYAMPVEAADVVDLVMAQVFARRDGYAAAERALARHLAGHPKDAAGRETLDWMRRKLGLPEGGGTRLLDADSVR